MIIVVVICYCWEKEREKKKIVISLFINVTVKGIEKKIIKLLFKRDKNFLNFRQCSYTH